ncbi:uncharacterized protein LOC117587812 [Drosophila guanche]|uniref:Uncharacterized protein n=1 Tax=Drosophila guanche TaxID=7266 RepID=A0A3B0JZE1_DROGU|nr:uncharacterized protein LOC117587812 [Drosophila guanche]SPP85792.1 Hypothetical predicted protein [Drosophila guanche]
MPETKTKTIPTPSDGRDNSDDGMAATNQLVERPQPAPPTNSRRQPRSHLSQQGRRDATDFTASQEVKLKAGDMRMAKIQISLSNLRTEMEETHKQLQNLCKTIKVDVDEE